MKVQFRLNKKEEELRRVLNIISNLSFFVKNNYHPRLPKISNKLLKGIEAKDEESLKELKKIIAKEYKDNQKKYNSVLKKMREGWESYGKDFFLLTKKVLKINPQDVYEVRLTAYGTEGSYNIPSIIVMNIFARKTIKYHSAIAHELIHLFIENLISKYKISHWEKERLVDLILNKTELNVLGDSFYQDIPKKAKTDKVFEKYISKGIKEVMANL